MAGVGGIWKCRGESLPGEEAGEYMGEDTGLELRRRGDGVLGAWKSRILVGPGVGDVFPGDVLSFFLLVGETADFFLGDPDDDDFLLVFGGMADFMSSLYNADGDGALVSFPAFGFGGDFLTLVGGDGGGGAAFSAGIVIGEGTFLGENWGDIGEFSLKILNFSPPKSFSSASSFLRFETSLLLLPFFDEPFFLLFLSGFLTTIIFPFTTDIVTSPSSPALELLTSSRSLSESLVTGLDTGDSVRGLGELLLLKLGKRDSGFGVLSLFSSLIEEVHAGSPPTPV